jgi:succinyl-diaminopimelate desuccinylase
LQQHPEPALSIAFLITSDEEGPSKDGTLVVVRTSSRRAASGWTTASSGEPTSVERLGDMIKNGRRGTLSGKLQRQRYSGPHCLPATGAQPTFTCSRRRWPNWWRPNGTVAMRIFPPTSWQVSNIHGGTGAGNVIPGELVVDFNFRFSTESTADAS